MPTRDTFGRASAAILLAVCTKLISESIVPLWASIAIASALGIVFFFWNKPRLIWALLVLGCTVVVWQKFPQASGMWILLLVVGGIVWIAYRLGKMSGSPLIASEPPFIGWISEGSVIEQLQDRLMREGYSYFEAGVIRMKLATLIQEKKLRARAMNYHSLQFDAIGSSNLDRLGTAGVEIWSEDVDRIAGDLASQLQLGG